MLHIVCLGNLLQGDDGFGIHVCHRLRERRWPADVRVFDGGLAGLGALAFFEGCEEVIVVDALAQRGRVGRVHTLRLDDVAEPREAFSVHQIDVNHLFHMLPIVFEGRAAPRVRVVGVEAEVGDGAFTMDLTPALVPAVDEAVGLIEEMVRARGPTPS